MQLKDDPYIGIAEQGVRAVFAAAVPGTFLVDALPALKYVPDWVPFSGFKRKAKEWRALTRRMLEEPFAAAKRQIVNNLYVLFRGIFC